MQNGCTQVKEETDQYLAQLEEQGRASEVVGDGGTLLVPEPGIALKTRIAGAGPHVYINVCTSAKVEAFTQRPSTDPSRPGLHVDMPISLGAAKQLPSDTSPAGWVWDAVVHPITLQRAQDLPAFRALLLDVVSPCAGRGGGGTCMWPAEPDEQRPAHALYC